MARRAVDQRRGLGLVLRYEIWLVALDPTIGSEIAKTRLCVIISPDELNRWLKTVVVAPLTSVPRGWPYRIPVRFANVDGEIALDQIRSVDKTRLAKRLGALSSAEAKRAADALVEMFKQ